MIKNVADLLASILQDEIPIMDAFPISHGPTIGQMYEGLSGKILERAIPQHLGLSVVTGFVSAGETSSGEIDRMVVRGHGRPIPHTDKFVWHPKDLVAVIEVKKTLNAATLPGAVDQLRTVRDVETAWIRENGEKSPDEATADPRLALRAFEQMTGRVAPPPDELATLPIGDRLVYSTLYTEQFSILRIVLGIHGYRTEAGLRRALARMMEERAGVRGVLTPGGMPHLIIGGKFSIVKANGQPYTAPLIDGEWSYAFSTPVNPILLLLELLWTRLDHLYGLGNPWGDDLEMEVGHRLIAARGTEAGWVCRLFDAGETVLRRLPETESWAPARLTETEFIALNELASGERLNLSDASLHEWLQLRGQTASQLRDGLLATRLVAQDGDDLVIVGSNCTTAILPTGEFVAADDSTGRLTRWIVRRRLETSHEPPP